ncbi:MAG: putative Serine Threonine protein kinase [Streblomastix strix]|uniref:Putative Serine Threonine protein kinase n=1 Tax=Streblomastix strix TaxID=222440 RepID=A0A5J4WRM0_9EUKA|nr:MAG: putative Serine Threonine protein kinase [Streblomastix strix]
MDVPHIPHRPSLQDLQKSSFLKSVIFTDTLLKSRDEQSGIRTINQYVVHQKIGEGAYAKVKLVHIINEPNKVYAMKVVKKDLKKKNRIPSFGNPLGTPLGSPFGQARGQDYDINREVALMKKMKHPNIVRLREVIDDNQMRKLYMILELVKGGPCFQYDQEPLNEEQARSYFIDTIIGISFIHKNHIVHHDIKPANLL